MATCTLLRAEEESESSKEEKKSKQAGRQAGGEDKQKRLLHAFGFSSCFQEFLPRLPSVMVVM